MDELLWIVDPLVGKSFGVDSHSESTRVSRDLLVLSSIIFLGTGLLYTLYSGITFFLFFFRRRSSDLAATRVERHTIVGRPSNSLSENRAYWVWDMKQVWHEIQVSAGSTAILSVALAFIDRFILSKYSKMYSRVDDFGWPYLIFSGILFVFFSDLCVYWIHRWMHLPSLYWIHKLHHTYKETTPWSALVFHPLDSFLQTAPHHAFPLLFPMHGRLYILALIGFIFWDINLHDRIGVPVWGINGAAHHAIHHTKFLYNYAPYFSLCDKVCGTYMDPFRMWPFERADRNKVQPEDSIPRSKVN